MRKKFGFLGIATFGRSALRKAKCQETLYLQAF